MWNGYIFYNSFRPHIFCQYLNIVCLSAAFKNLFFSLPGLNCNDIYSLLQTRCLSLFTNTLCSMLI